VAACHAHGLGRAGGGVSQPLTAGCVTGVS
jgi:hypothetical protein